MKAALPCAARAQWVPAAGWGRGQEQWELFRDPSGQGLTANRAGYPQAPGQIQLLGTRHIPGDGDRLGVWLTD